MQLKLINDQSNEDIASDDNIKISKKKTSSVASKTEPFTTFNKNCIPKKKKKNMFDSQFLLTRKMIPANIKKAPKSNKKYLGKN